MEHDTHHDQKSSTEDVGQATMTNQSTEKLRNNYDRVLRSTAADHYCDKQDKLAETAITFRPVACGGRDTETKNTSSNLFDCDDEGNDKETEVQSEAIKSKGLGRRGPTLTLSVDCRSLNQSIASDCSDSDRSDTDRRSASRSSSASASKEDKTSSNAAVLPSSELSGNGNASLDRQARILLDHLNQISHRGGAVSPDVRQRSSFSSSSPTTSSDHASSSSFTRTGDSETSSGSTSRDGNSYNFAQHRTGHPTEQALEQSPTQNPPLVRSNTNVYASNLSANPSPFPADALPAADMTSVNTDVKRAADARTQKAKDTYDYDSGEAKAIARSREVSHCGAFSCTMRAQPVGTYRGGGREEGTNYSSSSSSSSSSSTTGRSQYSSSGTESVYGSSTRCNEEEEEEQNWYEEDHNKNEEVAEESVNSRAKKNVISGLPLGPQTQSSGEPHEGRSGKSVLKTDRSRGSSLASSSRTTGASRRSCRGRRGSHPPHSSSDAFRRHRLSSAGPSPVVNYVTSPLPPPPLLSSHIPLKELVSSVSSMGGWRSNVLSNRGMPVPELQNGTAQLPPQSGEEAAKAEQPLHMPMAVNIGLGVGVQALLGGFVRVSLSAAETKQQLTTQRTPALTTLTPQVRAASEDEPLRLKGANEAGSNAAFISIASEGGQRIHKSSSSSTGRGLLAGGGGGRGEEGVASLQPSGSGSASTNPSSTNKRKERREGEGATRLSRSTNSRSTIQLVDDEVRDGSDAPLPLPILPLESPIMTLVVRSGSGAVSAAETNRRKRYLGNRKDCNEEGQFELVSPVISDNNRDDEGCAPATAADVSVVSRSSTLATGSNINTNTVATATGVRIGHDATHGVGGAPAGTPDTSVAGGHFRYNNNSKGNNNNAIDGRGNNDVEDDSQKFMPLFKYAVVSPLAERMAGMNSGSQQHLQLGSGAAQQGSVVTMPSSDSQSNHNQHQHHSLYPHHTFASISAISSFGGGAADEGPQNCSVIDSKELGKLISTLSERREKDNAADRAKVVTLADPCPQDKMVLPDGLAPLIGSSAAARGFGEDRIASRLRSAASTTSSSAAAESATSSSHVGVGKTPVRSAFGQSDSHVGTSRVHFDAASGMSAMMPAHSPLRGLVGEESGVHVYDQPEGQAPSPAGISPKRRLHHQRGTAAILGRTHVNSALAAGGAGHPFVVSSQRTKRLPPPRVAIALPSGSPIGGSTTQTPDRGHSTANQHKLVHELKSSSRLSPPHDEATFTVKNAPAGVAPDFISKSWACVSTVPNRLPYTHAANPLGYTAQVSCVPLIVPVFRANEFTDALLHLPSMVTQPNGHDNFEGPRISTADGDDACHNDSLCADALLLHPRVTPTSSLVSGFAGASAPRGQSRNNSDSSQKGPASRQGLASDSDSATPARGLLGRNAGAGGAKKASSPAGIGLLGSDKSVVGGSGWGPSTHPFQSRKPLLAPANRVGMTFPAGFGSQQREASVFGITKVVGAEDDDSTVGPTANNLLRLPRVLGSAAARGPEPMSSAKGEGLGAQTKKNPLASVSHGVLSIDSGVLPNRLFEHDNKAALQNMKRPSISLQTHINRQHAEEDGTTASTISSISGVPHTAQSHSGFQLGVTVASGAGVGVGGVGFHQAEHPATSRMLRAKRLLVKSDEVPSVLPVQRVKMSSPTDQGEGEGEIITPLAMHGSRPLGWHGHVGGDNGIRESGSGAVARNRSSAACTVVGEIAALPAFVGVDGGSARDGGTTYHSAFGYRSIDSHPNATAALRARAGEAQQTDPRRGSGGQEKASLPPPSCTASEGGRGEVRGVTDGSAGTYSTSGGSAQSYSNPGHPAHAVVANTFSSGSGGGHRGLHPSYSEAFARHRRDPPPPQINIQHVTYGCDGSVASLAVTADADLGSARRDVESVASLVEDSSGGFSQKASPVNYGGGGGVGLPCLGLRINTSANGLSFVGIGTKSPAQTPKATGRATHHQQPPPPKPRLGGFTIGLPLGSTSPPTACHPSPVPMPKDLVVNKGHSSGPAASSGRPFFPSLVLNVTNANASIDDSFASLSVASNALGEHHHNHHDRKGKKASHTSYSVAPGASPSELSVGPPSANRKGGRAQPPFFGFGIVKGSQQQLSNSHNSQLIGAADPNLAGGVNALHIKTGGGQHQYLHGTGTIPTGTSTTSATNNDSLIGGSGGFGLNTSTNTSVCNYSVNLQRKEKKRAADGGRFKINEIIPNELYLCAAKTLVVDPAVHEVYQRNKAIRKTRKRRRKLIVSTNQFALQRVAATRPQHLVAGSDPTAQSTADQKNLAHKKSALTSPSNKVTLVGADSAVLSMHPSSSDESRNRQDSDPQAAAHYFGGNESEGNLVEEDDNEMTCRVCDDLHLTAFLCVADEVEEMDIVRPHVHQCYENYVRAMRTDLPIPLSNIVVQALSCYSTSNRSKQETVHVWERATRATSVRQDGLPRSRQTQPSSSALSSVPLATFSPSNANRRNNSNNSHSTANSPRSTTPSTTSPKSNRNTHDDNNFGDYLDEKPRPPSSGYGSSRSSQQNFSHHTPVHSRSGAGAQHPDHPASNPHAANLEIKGNRSSNPLQRNPTLLYSSSVFGGGVMPNGRRSGGEAPTTTLNILSSDRRGHVGGYPPTIQIDQAAFSLGHVHMNPKGERSTNEEGKDRQGNLSPSSHPSPSPPLASSCSIQAPSAHGPRVMIEWSQHVGFISEPMLSLTGALIQNNCSATSKRGSPTAAARDSLEPILASSEPRQEGGIVYEPLCDENEIMRQLLASSCSSEDGNDKENDVYVRKRLVQEGFGERQPQREDEGCLSKIISNSAVRAFGSKNSKNTSVTTSSLSPSANNAKVLPLRDSAVNQLSPKYQDKKNPKSPSSSHPSGRVRDASLHSEVQNNPFLPSKNENAKGKKSPKTDALMASGSFFDSINDNNNDSVKAGSGAVSTPCASASAALHHASFAGTSSTIATTVFSTIKPVAATGGNFGIRGTMTNNNRRNRAVVLAAEITPMSEMTRGMFPAAATTANSSDQTPNAAVPLDKVAVANMNMAFAVRGRAGGAGESSMHLASSASPLSPPLVALQLVQGIGQHKLLISNPLSSDGGDRQLSPRRPQCDRVSSQVNDSLPPTTAPMTSVLGVRTKTSADDGESVETRQQGPPPLRVMPFQITVGSDFGHSLSGDSAGLDQAKSLSLGGSNRSQGGVRHSKDEGNAMEVAFGINVRPTSPLVCEASGKFVAADRAAASFAAAAHSIAPPPCCDDAFEAIPPNSLSRTSMSPKLELPAASRLTSDGHRDDVFAANAVDCAINTGTSEQPATTTTTTLIKPAAATNVSSASPSPPPQARVIHLPVHTVISATMVIPAGCYVKPKEKERVLSHLLAQGTFGRHQGLAGLMKTEGFIENDEESDPSFPRHVSSGQQAPRRGQAVDTPLSPSHDAAHVAQIPNHLHVHQERATHMPPSSPSNGECPVSTSSPLHRQVGPITAHLASDSSFAAVAALNVYHSSLGTPHPPEYYASLPPLTPKNKNNNNSNNNNNNNNIVVGSGSNTSGFGAVSGPQISGTPKMTPTGAVGALTACRQVGTLALGSGGSIQATYTNSGSSPATSPHGLLFPRLAIGVPPPTATVRPSFQYHPAAVAAGLMRSHHHVSGPPEPTTSAGQSSMTAGGGRFRQRADSLSPVNTPSNFIQLFAKTSAASGVWSSFADNSHYGRGRSNEHSLGTDDIAPPLYSASAPPPPLASSFVQTAGNRIHFESSAVPEGLEGAAYTTATTTTTTIPLIRICHLPLTDMCDGEIFCRQQKEAFAFIEKCRSEGRKVVVFCREAKSRSPSTVIAYLMRRYGWTFSKSVKYVRSKCTTADPNIRFCIFLTRLQEVIEEEKAQNAKEEEHEHQRRQQQHRTKKVKRESRKSARTRERGSGIYLEATKDGSDQSASVFRTVEGDDDDEDKCYTRSSVHTTTGQDSSTAHSSGLYEMYNNSNNNKQQDRDRDTPLDKCSDDGGKRLNADHHQKGGRNGKNYNFHPSYTPHLHQLSSNDMQALSGGVSVGGGVALRAPVGGGGGGTHFSFACPFPQSHPYNTTASSGGFSVQNLDSPQPHLFAVMGDESGAPRLVLPPRAITSGINNGTARNETELKYPPHHQHHNAVPTATITTTTSPSSPPVYVHVSAPLHSHSSNDANSKPNGLPLLLSSPALPLMAKRPQLKIVTSNSSVSACNNDNEDDRSYERRGGSSPTNSRHVNTPLRASVAGGDCKNIANQHSIRNRVPTGAILSLGEGLGCRDRLGLCQTPTEESEVQDGRVPMPVTRSDYETDQRRRGETQEKNTTISSNGSSALRFTSESPLHPHHALFNAIDNNKVNFGINTCNNNHNNNCGDGNFPSLPSALSPPHSSELRHLFAPNEASSCPLVASTNGPIATPLVADDEARHHHYGPKMESTSSTLLDALGHKHRNENKPARPSTPSLEGHGQRDDVSSEMADSSYTTRSNASDVEEDDPEASSLSSSASAVTGHEHGHGGSATNELPRHPMSTFAPIVKEIFGAETEAAQRRGAIRNEDRAGDAFPDFVYSVSGESAAATVTGMGSEAPSSHSGPSPASDAGGVGARLISVSRATSSFSAGAFSMSHAHNVSGTTSTTPQGSITTRTSRRVSPSGIRLTAGSGGGNSTASRRGTQYGVGGNAHPSFLATNREGCFLGVDDIPEGNEHGSSSSAALAQQSLSVSRSCMHTFLVHPNLSSFPLIVSTANQHTFVDLEDADGIPPPPHSPRQQPCSLQLHSATMCMSRLSRSPTHAAAAFSVHEGVHELLTQDGGVDIATHRDEGGTNSSDLLRPSVSCPSSPVATGSAFTALHGSASSTPHTFGP